MEPRKQVKDVMGGLGVKNRVAEIIYRTLNGKEVAASNRDINAAKNIKAAGLAVLASGD